MRSENLRKIFEDKKEAVDVVVKNLMARNRLRLLLEQKEGFISEVKYYREGEDIFLGEPLKLRGYHPEDTLSQNIKENIRGSAVVKVSVTGNGFFEKIPIIKRK